MQIPKLDPKDPGIRMMFCDYYYYYCVVVVVVIVIVVVAVLSHTVEKH